MPSNWEKKKQSKLHFLVSSELLVTGTDCFNMFAGQIENQNALSLQTQIAVRIILILKEFLYLSEMLPSRPSKALYRHDVYLALLIFLDIAIL